MNTVHFPGDPGFTQAGRAPVGRRCHAPPGALLEGLSKGHSRREAGLVEQWWSPPAPLRILKHFMSWPPILCHW